MTETQREAVPREDGGELATARAFLDFARHCVLKKTEGLTEEQLRRVLVPSGTSLLGLVQHLTVGERFWLGHHFSSDYEDVEWNFDMTVAADVSVADVLDAYRAAIAEADAVIDRLGDVEARTVQPVDGRHLPLRWVLAHHTTEITRHAGHADILRELIDGVTGR
jgi:uncharacterized damage-inducible protein DinB